MQTTTTIEQTGPASASLPVHWGCEHDEVAARPAAPFDPAPPMLILFPEGVAPELMRRLVG